MIQSDGWYVTGLHVCRADLEVDSLKHALQPVCQRVDGQLRDAHELLSRDVALQQGGSEQGFGLMDERAIAYSDSWSDNQSLRTSLRGTEQELLDCWLPCGLDQERETAYTSPRSLTE